MTEIEGAESRMLSEAREAPAVVAHLLAANATLCRELGRRLRGSPPPFAVSCARGSSDNAATYAKYLFEIRLGLVTASVGPSVRSVYAAAPNMRRALFFAISQSGRSPDILHLAEAARAGGALTVAFVNDVGSPLADICEVTVPLHAWPEQSVAATKSFIASMAAILQFVAHWADDAELLAALDTLPEALERAASRDWGDALPVIAGAEHLYVVGRGIGLGVAQEAALKLKETCGIHAEALSAAELMHGPATLAGRDFPVLVFSQQDETRQGVADLIGELSARGVPVISAGPVAGSIALPADPAVNSFATPIALIQNFYPLVARIARERGRDPDRPPHLSKVTETV